jgi:hypothetical protein
VFKSSEYGNQSTGVQNSVKNCCVALAVWAWAKSAERHIFHQDTSCGPRGLMLSLKLLVDVGVDMSTGRTWPSVT